jgi:hypothetical protein
MRTIDHCVRPGRIVLVEPQACNEGEKGVNRWPCGRSMGLVGGARRALYLRGSIPSIATICS